MILSNFEIIKKEQDPFFKYVKYYIYYAEVDVTKGIWWWKKTERRKICKRSGDWFFVDTGTFTPGYQVERLFRSWQAKNGFEE